MSRVVPILIQEDGGEVGGECCRGSRLRTEGIPGGSLELQEDPKREREWSWGLN